MHEVPTVALTIAVYLFLFSFLWVRSAPVECRARSFNVAWHMAHGQGECWGACTCIISTWQSDDLGVGFGPRKPPAYTCPIRSRRVCSGETIVIQRE